MDQRHQRTTTRGLDGRYERINAHLPYITVRTNILTAQQLQQRAEDDQRQTAAGTAPDG